MYGNKKRGDGFSGFIMPRLSDGSFMELEAKHGWDGDRYQNRGFYEGTAWVYSYGVLHDIPGMVELMGGRVRFAERLEHAFQSGLIDTNNEPSFSTAWLFSDVGRSWRSSTWANAFFSPVYPPPVTLRTKITAR